MRTSRAVTSIVILAALVATGWLLAEGRRGRFARGGFGPGSSTLGAQPLARNDAEKLILETASQVPRRANVPLEDGRMIRMLTEAIGAKQAVEIGTSTGYSGLWFAMALKATGGKLTTFEIDSRTAATARESFAKAGVSDIVTVVEGDAHETVSRLEGPIDIVFIDADKPGYRDYLEKLLPLLRPGGLILAHNIGSASSNPDYVEAVTTNPALETLLFSGGNGMTITLKKR